jgi:hypothetical protein
MSEELCTFVSSRGILKSTNIHSNNPISSCPVIHNYLANCISCKHGDTIYVCASAIQHFIPHINKPIILVSGDCDLTIPFDIFRDETQFHQFINNPNIIHWYAQNCVINHPKISRIPIGLDYHTISTNKTHAWGDQMSPFEQEHQIHKIKNESKPFYERVCMGYSNFHFFTTSRFGKDRQTAILQIPKELIYYEPSQVNRETSWKTQSTYAFVISPHGNGLDCHRTWEALVLGCIPIVKTSGLDPLYADLPVLIINEWSDVSIHLLQKTMNEFKTKEFHLSKLTLSHWIHF